MIPVCCDIAPMKGASFDPLQSRTYLSYHWDVSATCALMARAFFVGGRFFFFFFRECQGFLPKKGRQLSLINKLGIKQ